MYIRPEPTSLTCGLKWRCIAATRDERQRHTRQQLLSIPETRFLKDPCQSEGGGTALQRHWDAAARVTSKKRPHHTGTNPPVVWHDVFHWHYKELVTFIIYDKRGATDKSFIGKSIFYSSFEKISDIILKLIKKRYQMFDPEHDVLLMETNSKTDIICLLGIGVHI